MNAVTLETLPQPTVGDHNVWDVIFQFWGSPALLVAHDLQLFALLGERPRTLQEICDARNLQPRAAEALIAMNAAFGFIESHDGRYALTQVASQYLDDASPLTLGPYLDFLVKNAHIWSFDTLKRAVLTNSPQMAGGKDLFSTPEAQRAFAHVFTRAMYAHSVGAAASWPDAVNLASGQTLLDIGGGSGVHTVGALIRWPNLTGIVLDTPPVVAEAERHVARFGLGARLTLQAADMWTDPFPPADVHFYGDILHDWPRAKGAFLARKSFDALPSGGTIVLREVLFDDTKAGPLPAAAYSLNMLLVTQGAQYSARELTTVLHDAGFRNIEVHNPGAGYRNIVVAHKP
jgi:hypothetical protein